MSTVEPEHEATLVNVTDRPTHEGSNVTVTSLSTTSTVTKTTEKNISTPITENLTKIVHETTTAKNGKTTKDVTDFTTSYNTSESVVTDVTSTKMSQPVTRTSSVKNRVTNDYTSTMFPFTNTTFNSTVSNMVMSTQVDESSVGIKKMSDDCMETVAIVSGVCAGLVLLNLVVSVLCFFRLRHKWRAKIQLERQKTDIWSMATYNNTIINENFSDYQLASTTNKKGRKTSRFSEDSIKFYDPFANALSQGRFASNHDDIALRHETLPPEARADFSTLRRNTVSAPEELDSKLQTLRIEPDHFGFDEDRTTLRGRSSTFTVGRKNNVDRHVLLSHEELVEDQAVSDIGKTGSRYNMRTNSYHITEL